MYCAFTQNRTFIPIKKNHVCFYVTHLEYTHTPGVYTHILILLPVVKEILFLCSKYSFSSLKTKFLVKSPTPSPPDSPLLHGGESLRVWG